MMRTTLSLLAAAGTSFAATALSAQIKPTQIVAPTTANPTGGAGLSTVNFGGEELTVLNAFPLLFSFTTNKFSTALTVESVDTATDQVAVIYDVDTDTLTPIYRDGVTPYSMNAALVIGPTIPAINDHDQIAQVFTAGFDLGGASMFELMPRVVVGTPDMMGDYTFETIVVGMNDEIPEGIFGVPETFTSFDFFRVDNEGQIAFFDDAFGIPGGPDAAFVNIDLANATDQGGFNLFAGVGSAIETLTVPAGQTPDDPTRVVTSVSEYRIDQTGENFLYDGSLDSSVENGGDTNDVLVLNGVVVVQEGVVWNNDAQTAAGLPDMDPVDSVDDPEMNANGDYMFLVSFDSTSADYVAYVPADGSDPRLVAAEGKPISPFVSGENWRVISDFLLNANGDYVIIGESDEPDSDIDTIAVFNSYILVAREGSTSVDTDPSMPGDEAVLGRVRESGDLANSGTTLILRNALLDGPGGSSVAADNANSLLRFDFDRADVDASGEADTIDLIKALNNLAAFDFNLDGENGDVSDVNDLLNSF